MTVSVIVPVYNTEKYLKACVDSILSQTHKDLQVILINDGSTDKSGEICNSYQEKDSRVIVKHTENMGVSHARNVGLNCATGDYIAFVDSDDTIKPDMYETLLRIAHEYKVQIVSSDFLFNGKPVKNSLEENTVYNEGRIKNEVLPQFTYSNSIGIFEFKNKIFATSLIKDNNIRFYEGFSYQEDLMFMINIYAHTKSLYYLPQAFYEYVPLPTGLYSSYRSDSGEKFIRAREIMLSLIQEYNIKNIDNVNFDNSFLYNISYFIYRTKRYIKNHKEQKSIIKKTLTSSVTLECCSSLCVSAESFDRRIASAISKGNIKLAVFLICFVHSGKAGKIQKTIAKLKKR